MFARALAIAAALLTGAPASAGSGSAIWVELCAAGRPDARIPLPLHHDEEERDPAKACHATCTSLTDRRGQRTRDRR